MIAKPSYIIAANLFPGNLAQAQAQEAKVQRDTESVRREAQPMMDFNSKYQHLQQFAGGNAQSYTNPLLMKQQPAKQQQQQQAANIYGGFDFPNNPMYGGTNILYSNTINATHRCCPESQNATTASLRQESHVQLFHASIW